ncbi:MAG: ABC transporter permease [Actinomycetota bacterium]
MSRRIAFSLAAPVGAFVLTVIISTIALWIFGSNPFEAYGDMIGHARKLETQVDILNRATPFYLSAVAAAIGFRMNLFNIGVEGQYLFAFLIAAQIGSMVDLPMLIHIPVIMLVAMGTGALYAGIAGVLKTTRGVNEVVSTIMLNAIAVAGLIAWLQREWQAELGDNFSSSDLGTNPIDESGLLPTINWLPEIFTREIGLGKELTGMLLVAVLVGIAYHVLLNRTRFGFDLRASGINPFAARAGGVPPKRMVVAAMMLSGAVAGLIGMVELSDEGKFPPDPIQGLGFQGIAVALLGRNHPGGMVFSALLFAFLDISSGVLDTTGAASREIATIMQGIVLLTAVIAYGVASRFRAREEAAAAARAIAEDAPETTEGNETAEVGA